MITAKCPYNLPLKFSLKYFLSARYEEKYEPYKVQKKCFVFLAANYGNLGDVAITYAQELFLKKIFQDYIIIDVPISDTLSDLKAIKNICTPDDIITIVGGGNMSDLYFDIELLRQMVISKFPKNRVISFPQTLYYTPTNIGRFWQNKSVQCYAKHKHLLLMAREMVSYQLMSTLYPNKVICMPDIVMTLDESTPIQQRVGITLCLRNDMEKSSDISFTIELKKELLKIGYKIFEKDTHLGRGGLSMDERKIELNRIWDTFRKSEWVITDRLHGMIFCFITKTPCIVLPNNNFKVEKCYEWIKDCGYVFFLKNYDIEEIMTTLSKKHVDNFQNVHQEILKKFNQHFK